MEKRGLSAVVTTLIIILLVLVSVGIIWVVVRGVVESGAEQIDVSTKCLGIDIRAVSVEPVNGEEGNYSVNLERKSGGNEIEGIKVNVFNDTDSSGVMDFGVAIEELNEETVILESGIIDANKIEYTAYFKDASGNDISCTYTGEFNF